MDINELFDALVGSYHDGALIDAAFKNEILYMYCFRNPPDFYKTEKYDTRYIIIRFDGVTDLEIYDFGNKNYIPYTDKAFSKGEDSWAITGVDYLDYEDECIVFGQCMRFKAESVVVLAHSNEELDFKKYLN